MRLIEYSDAKAFLADTGLALSADEAMNNMPLGILTRGADGDAKPDWFMARVECGVDACALIALMTPPYNLLLASPNQAVPEGAILHLAEHLVERGIQLPGVLAEEALSYAFACAFAPIAEKTMDVANNEILYRLDRVEDVPVVGSLRPATENDLHFLPYWMKCFTDECFHVQSPLDVENTRWSIDHATMYLLEEGGRPVTMAGSTRQMPNGRSIGPVYTPPFFRGRGYATACVALLSRLILEKGNRYCVLFADRMNPTSNDIYRKIGYRPLCGFTEIHFA
jgi:predicted GNAT family acetyltransferase